jgi:DNA-binding NarL/FixJ family response regulator
MTEEVKKRTERLLNNISKAAAKEDWNTVYELSEVVLSLDPDNASAASTLTMSKQLLKTQPGEVKERPSVASKEGRCYEGRGAPYSQAHGDTSAPYPDIVSTPSAHRTPFIGREEEMELLRAALDGAIGGHGSVILLAGEPGMGKTRCLEELISVASNREVQILVGHCEHDAAAPPCRPWTEILRRLLRYHPGGRVRELVDSSMAELAVLVPGIRSTPANIDPSVTKLLTVWENHRLADAIADFLHEALISSPSLLILEDSHWADDPSLRLFDAIAREITRLPLLAIATVRSDEVRHRGAVEEFVTGLARRSSSMSVDLRGLEVSEVAELSGAGSGGHVTEKIARDLRSATGGNPLFVLEVSRLRTRDTSRNWVSEVPRGIRLVIQQRLAHLDNRIRSLLDIAAVIGERFDAEMIEWVCEHSRREEIDYAMAECRTEGIIVPEPGNRTVCRFAHALYRAVLLDDLAEHRRGELHACIAGFLRALYPSSIADHVTEIAYHLVHAHPRNDTMIAQYALLAGQVSLERNDYDSALTWFEQGLEAAKVREELTSDRDAALVYGAARSKIMINSSSSPEELIRVFDYYLAQGDIAKAIEIAAAPMNYGFGSLAAGTTAMIERALEHEKQPSKIRAALLCEYARMLYQERGDVESSALIRAEALALATEMDDVRLILVARYPTVFWVAPLEPGISLETRQDDLEAARRIGDRLLEQRVLANLLWWAYINGHLGAAIPYLRSALDLASRVTSYTALPLSLVVFMIAMDLGDRRTMNSVTDALRDAHRPGAAHYLQTLELLNSGRMVGDWDEVHPYLEAEPYSQSAVRVMPAVQIVVAGCTAIHAHQTGGNDLLDEAFRAARAFRDASKWIHHVALADAALGVIAVVSGDAGLAEIQYRQLMQSPLQVFNMLMARHRLLGLLALAMGKSELARRHLDEAVRVLAPSGSRRELGWSMMELAELLVKMGGEDERQIEHLLAQSAQIGRSLELPWLIRRVEALRKRVDPTGHGLSSRERSVLALLAQGLTNKEIGAKLFITERTVAKHVGAILAKTGVGNRTEAAALALRSDQSRP